MAKLMNVLKVIYREIRGFKYIIIYLLNKEEVDRYIDEINQIGDMFCK